MLGKKITIYCNTKDKTTVSAALKTATVKSTDMAGGVILEDESGKRVDESIEARSARLRAEMRRQAVVIMGE